MTLAAADLGLGTCWVCAFNAEKCHEVLGLPENIEAIAMMPIGYAADDKEPEKKRKSIDEIVSWEGYKY